MNPRERITAALNHREPDRTPVFEYVLQPPVADAVLEREYLYGERLAGFVKEHGWEKSISQMATDMVEIAVRLKHDMIYAVPNPAPGDFAKRDSGIKKAPCFSDPVEDIRYRLKQSEEKTYTPQEERFFIYRCLKESMKDSGVDLPILAPAYAHGVWTDVSLMQAMLLAPELVSRWYERRTEDTIRLIDIYNSLGIEMFGVGGDFAGTKGPLISPDAYRKFIMPEIRKLSRHIHSLGKTAVNASDGNLWPVIGDFLLGCEVDGYIEIDYFAGMDLYELKKRYGNRITFFGNLDCGNILSFGSIEEIKIHVRQTLEKGWGNGGHIFCASNAITESISPENYFAVYDEYRKFFNLQ